MRRGRRWPRFGPPAVPSRREVEREDGGGLAGTRAVTARAATVGTEWCVRGFAMRVEVGMVGGGGWERMKSRRKEGVEVSGLVRGGHPA